MLSAPVTVVGQMDRLNAFMKSESLPYDLKLRLREYSLHPTFAAASSQSPNKVAKGFVAQEVAEVLPHAVRHFNKTYEAQGHDDLELMDMHHVQYDYIYLEMFGAVKELIAQLDDSKLEARKEKETKDAELAAMKEELAALKAQVQDLLARSQ